MTTTTTKTCLAGALIRSGADFEPVSGIELIKAKIAQVLGTAVGELPWRTDFGSRLHLLKHRSSSVTTKELARSYTVDVLTKEVPEISLSAVEVAMGDSKTVIKIRYTVRGISDPNSRANNVEVYQEVST